MCFPFPFVLILLISPTNPSLSHIIILLYDSKKSGQLHINLPFFLCVYVLQFAKSLWCFEHSWEFWVLSVLHDFFWVPFREWDLGVLRNSCCTHLFPSGCSKFGATQIRGTKFSSGCYCFSLGVNLELEGCSRIFLICAFLPSYHLKVP